MSSNSLQIPRERLTPALIAAARIAGGKSYSPAGSVTALKVNGALGIEAANLEMALAWTLPVDAPLPDSRLLVPAATLANLVTGLEGETVELVFEDELTIRAAGSKSCLHALAVDFPEMLPLEGEAVRLPATFKTMLNQVLPAVSGDETRPALTGVFLAVQGDSLSLAAADGFRLAECRATLDAPVEKEIKVVIPAKALKELTRLAGEAEICMFASEGLVQFQVGENIRLAALTIKHEFPDYQQIIPTGHNARIALASKDILTAFTRAGIFSQDAHVARFEAGGDTVRVSGNSEATGQAETVMSAEISGEIRFAINSLFAAKGIEVAEAEKVTIEAQNAQAPVVIRPEGKQAAHEYLCVIMPMYLPEAAAPAAQAA